MSQPSDCNRTLCSDACVLSLLPLLSKANARKLEEEKDELKGSMANSQDAAELKVAKEKNATLVCVLSMFMYL